MRYLLYTIRFLRMWTRKLLYDRPPLLVMQKNLGNLMRTKQRIKVGDVIEIPLPNGKNAYARRFNNSEWGFYSGYYQS